MDNTLKFNEWLEAKNKNIQSDLFLEVENVMNKINKEFNPYVEIYKNIKDESGQGIWGWIGIYYNTPNPYIMMGFYNNPGWGKGYIDMLQNKVLSKQTSFEKPYPESSCLWFEMSKDLRQKFEESEDVKEQESILKQFMDDVILYPLKQ